jgi:hypothetical protein
MTTGLNSEASTLYSAVNGCRGTHLPRYSHARAQATDTEPRARRGKNERLETKKQPGQRVSGRLVATTVNGPDT